MAIMYVSLCEAKDQLNQDQDHDDSKILLLIQAASGAVKNYLKDASVYEPLRNSDEDVIYDSDGIAEVDFTNQEVRMEVKQAVLILVEMYYDRSKGLESAPLGYLPAPVMNLLYPLRDPALR